MGKIIINIEQCKGCKLCVIFCPKQRIKLSEKLNPAGYHPAEFIDNGQCNSCGLCYQMCPDVAIEVWKEEKR
ncbi:MAG: 4Fe-4S dicluster domain-containing protein [Elusimicrobia bacterium]|nr:MAG: 4Fe-4S dicluster domain-containing protein [Elusimicrobiota bacterium]